MELKVSQETDDYRYFDPKQLRVADASQVPKNRTPFQEAIVFVVGGGNYIEYQNLVDYTKVRFRYLVSLCSFKLQMLMACFFKLNKQSKSGAGGPNKRIIYGSSTLNNAKQFLKQVCQQS